MARIIGGLTTSHIPAIGGAVPREDALRDEPYWKPFFDGYEKGARLAARAEAGRGRGGL
jgi:protocatechuate 4,5-dioxygenase beta chain